MKLAMRLGAVLLATAVLTAACGGDGSGDDEALIEALESSLDLDAEGLGDLDLDGRCASEAMVDALGGASGAEEKYGITAEVVTEDGDFDVDLEQADAEAAASGIWDCGMASAFAAGMTEAGLSQEDADCVTGSLDESILQQVLAAEFMGDAGASLMAEADEAIGSNMLDAMAECDVDIFG
ncbi:MAG: hypothetical protein AAFO29_18915 [Actinomycetota bacterium]